jgi:hypothetical protein
MALSFRVNAISARTNFFIDIIGALVSPIVVSRLRRICNSRSGQPKAYE